VTNERVTVSWTNFLTLSVNRLASPIHKRVYSNKNTYRYIFMNVYKNIDVHVDIHIFMNIHELYLRQIS
jgi:hypothetical protein